MYEIIDFAIVFSLSCGSWGSVNNTASDQGDNYQIWLLKNPLHALVTQCRQN